MGDTIWKDDKLIYRRREVPLQVYLSSLKTDFSTIRSSCEGKHISVLGLIDKVGEVER